MKHLKRFNEAKMFDNINMLLEHGDQFLSNFPLMTLEWNKQVSRITETSDGLSYKSTIISILKDKVNDKFEVLKSFVSDIESHLKELDDIYKVNQRLSEADDIIYDKLEELLDDFNIRLNETDQYKEQLEKLSDSYISLMDDIDMTLNFRFKS